MVVSRKGHFFQFFFFLLGFSAASSEATKTKPRKDLDEEVPSGSGAPATVFGFHLDFRLDFCSRSQPEVKILE